MKKLCMIVLIILVTQGSLLLGKKFRYTKELNNEISQNCQRVWPALFFKSELENACDYVEKYLQSRDTTAQSNPKSHSEAIATGAYVNWVCEELLLKSAIRKILTDEPDSVKWKNYNELNDFARQLKDGYINRKAAAEKQDAEKREQAKNAF
jgi:hypothetical protein